MEPARNIDEVISCLDKIIEDCILRKSRLGYFACLYRKMTVAVKLGIEDGFFEDGPRMEDLDVGFANRYIGAYSDYLKGLPITLAWKAAFDSAMHPYTVIQHLLMGMNAHINLDLGIAAAEVNDGRNIQLFKSDFDLINKVIGSLINNVQHDLEEICLPMRFLKYIDNKSKDAVINFSMNLARQTAWGNAVGLSTVESRAYDVYVNTLDSQIVKVARNIIKPDFSQSILLRGIAAFEPSNIQEIIRFLKD